MTSGTDVSNEDNDVLNILKENVKYQKILHIQPPEVVVSFCTIKGKSDTTLGIKCKLCCAQAVRREAHCCAQAVKREAQKSINKS